MKTPKLFQELQQIGYKHYTEKTVEELDELPLDSEERIKEQSLVLRWFMTKFNLRSFIGWRPNTKQWDCHVVNLKLNGLEYVKTRTFKDFDADPVFSTYEEAECESINQLIKVVNQL